jgi:hypothetical protein
MALTFDFTATVADSYEVTQNGTYRIFFSNEKRDSVDGAWTSDTVDPAGVLTFSHDGDPGDPQPVIDLGQNQTAFGLKGKVRFIDFEVANFPDGGSLTLYF